jgi:uncharacterized phiE125 gp8 family phage protein
MSYFTYYYKSWAGRNITKPIRPDEYILTSPAISPAVDLDKIKEQLRETFGTSDFDDQLLSLIGTATQYGEKLTGRDFINKTYKGYLDCFPSDCQGIEIRKSKLQSISSIQYLKDDVLVTLPSSDYYFTDSNNYSIIFLKEGLSWPKNIDNIKQAVFIEFVAGYGDDSCYIPALLRQALISHIVALFKNAGDCIDSDSSKAQYKQLYNAFILPNLLVCPI